LRPLLFVQSLLSVELETGAGVGAWAGAGAAAGVFTTAGAAVVAGTTAASADGVATETAASGVGTIVDVGAIFLKREAAGVDDFSAAGRSTALGKSPCLAPSPEEEFVVLVAFSSAPSSVLVFPSRAASSACHMHCFDKHINPQKRWFGSASKTRRRTAPFAISLWMVEGETIHCRVVLLALIITLTALFFSFSSIVRMRYLSVLTLS
jgi:hypothetical protein